MKASTLYVLLMFSHAVLATIVGAQGVNFLVTGNSYLAVIWLAVSGFNYMLAIKTFVAFNKEMNGD